MPSNHIGSLNLNLQRMFARSMSGDPELIGPPEPPSRGSGEAEDELITLAGFLSLMDLANIRCRFKFRLPI